MSEFLVYWTDSDIDAKAQEITKDVAKRLANAGIARHFGPISEVITSMAMGSNTATSGMMTSVLSATTSWVGHYLYYQHLLTARNARDTFENKCSGSIFDTDKVISSYSDLFPRIGKSLFS